MGGILKLLRAIEVETGVLPKAHGSALFTRGETQALVVTTLGAIRDAQLLEGLDCTKKDPFMLHYNFPPFSVGEAGFMGGPKRREIGHGRLARRGVAAVMPSEEDFPYAIRVVSEITESNGSSSMASVCGSSLSMMDAECASFSASCWNRNGSYKKKKSALQFLLTSWVMRIIWAIWTLK